MLGEPRRIVVLVSCSAGLILLIVAGRLVVLGGVRVGEALGLDLFVLGATIVALGTSVPELATTVVARLRSHEEVGLGTILGSCIFNGLLIDSVAAIIHPISIQWQDVAVGLGFGALVVAAILPTASGVIGRRRGALLLAIYAAFAVALVQMER